jgi:4'-phosphopantetheinyl transferase
MRERPTYRVEFVEGEGLLREFAANRRDLAPGEVIVALGQPVECVEPDQQSALMKLLSDEERERHSRFHFERDRSLYLTAHALLRISLSRHANVEPQAWQFRTGKYGRPEIAEPRSRLRFNLSHTHGLAACAVVLDRDIGMDVERITRDIPTDVAETTFSPRERSDILGTSATARARRFLEYWTLKEAYIKARGVGMSLPLDQFTFCKDESGVWRILFEKPLCDDPERWQFWSWQLGSGHQVALALDLGDKFVTA